MPDITAPTRDKSLLLLTPNNNSKDKNWQIDGPAGELLRFQYDLSRERACSSDGALLLQTVSLGCL